MIGILIVTHKELAEALRAMPEHLLARDRMPSRITDLEIAMRNDLHEYARRAMRRSPSIVTSTSGSGAPWLSHTVTVTSVIVLIGIVAGAIS